MSPHQERVVAEKQELDEKRTKLAAFIVGPIFSALDEIDRDLLTEQNDIMYEYSDVLRRRIERFT